MNMQTAVRTCFSKYVTFSGRATRSEYWWFTLFNMIVSVVLNIVDMAVIGAGVLGGIYSLVVLLPAISVLVRRLHDVGRSGWWFWIMLVPVIGFFVLLYWTVSAGTEGDNDYGSSDGSAADPQDDGLRPSAVPVVDRD